MTPAQLRALPGAHYSDGRRWSRISKAWILAEDWNDREEMAYLREKVETMKTDYAHLQRRCEEMAKALERAEAVRSEEAFGGALSDELAASKIARLEAILEERGIRICKQHGTAMGFDSFDARHYCVECCRAQKAAP